MKGSLNLVNRSVDTSGLPKDYKDALNEYIWNGFEAGATDISISYTLNHLNGLDSIIIEDNGEGIDFNNINDTFGTFLSSQKNQNIMKVKSGENKGKGRFSFTAFSSLAKWDTVYKDNDKFYEYSIIIEESSKNEFTYEEYKNSNNFKTGTIITFSNIKKLLPEELNFITLEDVLLKEYSWFLYLNKNQNYKLMVNDKLIDYTKYINLSLSKNTVLNIKGINFEVNVVVWEEKIKEKFCNYYYDENDVVKGVETTSFNRNTLDFNHSVYVKSSFFNHIDSVSLVTENAQMSLGDQGEDNEIIKELKKKIQLNISEIMKLYMIEKADRAINIMDKERKTFPKFSDNPYDQLRKKDLVNVTKQIYCLEPKIFYKLKEVQEKSLLGFLNLLLISEERENILSIIEQIVELTIEQRNSFADLLKKTKLENIIETFKFIEQRYHVIEILKTLVYDLTEFTTERNQIQKIIERHYWLFGDQYTLVSSDVGMKKALQNYSNILYGNTDLHAKLEPDQEEQRRMDIFLCTSRKTMNNLDVDLEENVIIELKAPKISLSKKVYRQTEDYMDYIRKQPEFNSIRRVWKFIAICNSVDDDIRSRYEAFDSYNKPGLVNKIDNYEIYALTWDDIFKSFELRHNFILEKLNYHKDNLLIELHEKGSFENSKMLDELTNAAQNIIL